MFFKALELDWVYINPMWLSPSWSLQLWAVKHNPGLFTFIPKSTSHFRFPLLTHKKASVEDPDAAATGRVICKKGQGQERKKLHERGCIQTHFHSTLSDWGSHLPTVRQWKTEGGKKRVSPETPPLRPKPHPPPSPPPLVEEGRSRAAASLMNAVHYPSAPLVGSSPV